MWKSTSNEEKKLFTFIIEITEYPAMILPQGRERRARRVWLVAAKLAENRGEFTNVHSQQCVILLKRCGTEDIGALVGKIQMENETIIWPPL